MNIYAQDFVCTNIFMSLEYKLNGIVGHVISLWLLFLEMANLLIEVAAFPPFPSAMYE